MYFKPYIFTISFLGNWERNRIKAISGFAQVSCMFGKALRERDTEKKDIDMQMIVLNFIERVHLS